MLVLRRIAPALLAGCLILACSSAALASGPATVTVRVEGIGQTTVPLTQVTTNTNPVVNGSEGSCPGTSALGALQQATAGNWAGTWSEKFKQYFIETIGGEALAGTTYYWSLWVNDVYSSAGACEVEPQPGDRLLYAASCFEGCPGGEATPLETEAPAAAGSGEAVQVAVKQYDMQGNATPAADASVEWSGGKAIADSSGKVALCFSSAGVYTLRVSGTPSSPPAIRAEATIDVHAAAGSCPVASVEVPPGSNGSTSTSSAPAGGSEAFKSSSAPYTGPYALVARATGVTDGHVYSRARAPRILTGTVIAHVPVRSVDLELRRTHRGRCYAYDGVSERFRHARCGHGSLFKVSTSSTFSYLLPEALRPGRYVLDLEASDAAGNRTALARGTSRIVFYVR